MARKDAGTTGREQQASSVQSVRATALGAGLLASKGASAGWIVEAVVEGAGSGRDGLQIADRGIDANQNQKHGERARPHGTGQAGGGMRKEGVLAARQTPPSPHRRLCDDEWANARSWAIAAVAGVIPDAENVRTR